MFSNSLMVMLRHKAEPDNTQTGVYLSCCDLRQSWVSTVGLGTLLRLSNTNVQHGHGVAGAGWVFWLGDLMLQVQWAMVRVRLGAGEESMVGRMERMSRRLSQPNLTGLCAGVASTALGRPSLSI